MKVAIAGQNIVLLPDRGAFWEEEKLLIVSDLHLGKVAAFQKAGIGVPEGAMEDDLRNLKQLIQELRAKRCVIVGDLIHARAGLSEGVIDFFAKWLDEIDCKVDLVFGNHDKALVKHLPESWNLKLHRTELKLGPFCFCHIPALKEGYFVWSGHIHPEIVLKSGTDRLRLRCFQIFEGQAVLPAFSTFVGGSYVKKHKGSQVFVIAGNQVIEV